MAPPATLLLGVPATVGQYELVSRIGQGGMAEVWMGRRASVGGATKSVAIKFMSARVATDERHRRMFLAEARLSMLMNHSNVVQVFDAGEDQGRLYLVMEWIDGLNLAQLCELRRQSGEPWPIGLVGYVIGEVLRGLAYAHHLIHQGRTQCVVHRDVSPHNVLVSTSGEVKLADFGVARLAAEETSGLHIKGKLRYMAPEHLGGRSREPTVDLYGAGAILHELLSGQRFRDEASEVDLYGHILGGRIPPLHRAGVPPELVSLREGLLAAQVQQRIPSASRALEYLDAWAGYRNESAALGRLCRATMGVAGPRSGIEAAALVDVEADTVEPSVATRTSGPYSQPGPTTVEVGASMGPTRVDGPPVRSRRRWLTALGILGAGFVVGGIGVVAWRRDGEPQEPPESPEPPGPQGMGRADPSSVRGGA
ncbi:MAG: serine/threonine-protein kinase, partial [Myxococcota bacterium]